MLQKNAKIPYVRITGEGDQRKLKTAERFEKEKVLLDSTYY